MLKLIMNYFNIFHSHYHSFLFKELQLSVTDKTQSRHFHIILPNNDRREHKEMMSLPSPSSINWAILNGNSRLRNNIVCSPGPKAQVR